ncbi:MAG: hypothetical protein HY676_01390 [Chloroflexi bacterium]|nr:hypothetical protein [Chloroflexota bacterium]
MRDLRQLYDLQLLDLEVDSRKEALARVDGSLVESQELLEAREMWKSLSQELAGLERQQRDQEGELQSLRSKLVQEEAKLYGGSVKNPRELAGLQAEVQSLKAQVGQWEDKILDIMAGLEDLVERERLQRASLQGMEVAWAEEEARLRAERESLLAEIDDLEKRRIKLASLVEGDILGLYERLRRTGQGRGVARVEGGICQGCRVNIPLHDILRSRSGNDLVRCSNCGRILFVT